MATVLDGSGLAVTVLPGRGVDANDVALVLPDAEQRIQPVELVEHRPVGLPAEIEDQTCRRLDNPMSNTVNAFRQRYCLRG